MTSRPSTKN